MTNFYSPPILTGYNQSPPANDGTQTSPNLVNWDTHTGKIGDPLKDFSEAINAQLNSTFEDITSIASNIAELTAITPGDSPSGSIFVQGYYDIGDGGGGRFYWDASSTATEDFGRTFEADEGGVGRWIRITEFTITAKQFGLTGDGATDDSSAMLFLMQSLEPKIDFQTFTYLLTTWTSHTQTVNKILIGNAIIDANGNASRFIKVHADVKSKDIIWKDWTLQVFSNLQTDTPPEIELKVLRGAFDNCIAPIDIEGAIVDGYCNKTRFIGCQGTVVRIGRNVYAEQDNWKRYRLMNCTFTDTAIHPTSTSTDTRCILIYGKDHHVTDNKMITMVGQSTSETHGIYTKARDSVVAGNIIKDVTIGSSISAINIKGSAKGVTVSPQGFGTNVTGNVIDTVLGGVRARCSDTLVSSNTIRNVKFGIETGSDSNDRNIYEGNYLFGTGVSGSIGVVVGIVNEDVHANDNTVIGFETSFKIGNQSGINAANGSVKGNKIKDTTTAFRIIPATGTTMDDITITDNSVTDATTMFLFDSGGTPNIFKIKGNTGTNITTYVSSTGATAWPKDIDFEQIFDIQTTDATLSNFFGPLLQDDSCYLMQSDVMANESNSSNRAAYSKRMLAYRDGGNATIQGTLVTLTPDIESDVGWGHDLAVSGSFMRGRVQGGAATTVDWKINLTIKGV